jgi:hypothetical protein
VQVQEKGMELQQMVWGLICVFSVLVVRFCNIVQRLAYNICAIRVMNDTYKVLIINVYMPYEHDNANISEFLDQLSIIESLIVDNPDYHIVVVGGDFNVSFSRECLHTALLDSFCSNMGFSLAVRHALCTVDYNYQFNMQRFNFLDHFLLSGTIFHKSVGGIRAVCELPGGGGVAFNLTRRGVGKTPRALEPGLT